MSITPQFVTYLAVFGNSLHLSLNRGSKGGAGACFIKEKEHINKIFYYTYTGAYLMCHKKVRRVRARKCPVLPK